MKHSGKPLQAGLKLILRALLIVAGIYAVAITGYYFHTLVKAVVYLPLILWVGFVCIVLYFFRDPEANIPADKDVVVSPSHGKIDVVEEYTESDFMGGKCKRISMFLSPLDVHVQRSPVNGKIAFMKHSPGKFMAAMKKDCGLHNENVLMGFNSDEVPGGKMAIRMIAGYLARRIVIWSETGEVVKRGERIGIIQFGSRCDIYLPLEMVITVKPGDRAVGGETILAKRS